MSELQAGRELDAMIAEKVMGWAPVLHYGERGTGYWAPSGCESDGAWVTDGDVPFYSADMAAAWEVVEEMARRGWKVDVQSRCPPRWAVHVNFALPITGRVFERSDSAPHAICLAALKALEVSQ